MKTRTARTSIARDAGGTRKLGAGPVVSAVRPWWTVPIVDCDCTSRIPILEAERDMLRERCGALQSERDRWYARAEFAARIIRSALGAIDGRRRLTTEYEAVPDDTLPGTP